MKIVLLGANGRTGRLVMRQALDGGHSVTGLVRSDESLQDYRHDRLDIRIGDVSDPSFLEEVLPGHDAVISTVGPRAPTRTACRIYADSAVAIAQAMIATGVNRVLVTSTALLFPPSGVFDHALRLLAKNNKNAAAVMEEVIREAGVDYTFARAGFLNDDDDPSFRISKSADALSRSISRAALANFLVTELERSAHVRKVVGFC